MATKSKSSKKNGAQKGDSSFFNESMVLLEVERTRENIQELNAALDEIEEILGDHTRSGELSRFYVKDRVQAGVKLRSTLKSLIHQLEANYRGILGKEKERRITRGTAMDGDYKRAKYRVDPEERLKNLGDKRRKPFDGNPNAKKKKDE